METEQKRPENAWDGSAAPDRTGSPSSGETPLDQIFKELAEALKKVEEVLEGARAVLVQGRHPGHFALAVRELRYHSARIEGHSAHIVRRLSPPRD